VPLRGPVIELAAATLIYLIATFGMTMLAANFVKSQQAAMLIMILVFFIPSFFLTGLIVPIDTSSPVMSIVSGILPASHYVVLARGVFLKGLPLTEFTSPIVILLIIGLTTLVATLAIFKKRIG